MSAKRPTVVLNEVPYDGGNTGYRVILSDGADIFGETGHVVETIAESDADIEEAILKCKLALQGWDAIDSADIEWLWENRPERIGKSAYHLSGAILEDVRRPLPTEATVTSGDSDSECITDYTPSTGAEGGKEVSHPDAEIAEPDCGHLPGYRIDGECLRCDLERHGQQDQAVKRELTADASGGSA